MNHSLLQSDLESLQKTNLEISSYKAKYEQLQSDIQNNVISSTVDSKQILLDFKEQNER